MTRLADANLDTTVLSVLARAVLLLNTLCVRASTSTVLRVTHIRGLIGWRDGRALESHPLVPFEATVAAKRPDPLLRFLTNIRRRRATLDAPEPAPATGDSTSRVEVPSSLTAAAPPIDKL